MNAYRLLALLSLSALAPATALAQSFGMGFDAGYRTDEFADGGVAETPTVGMNMMMVMGGESSRDFAILFPISGEIRYPMEMNADADMQMRVWNVSVGFGASVRMPGGDREWTLEGEDVFADEAIMAGYSGSAKISFGPQGRMYVQGRYTDLYQPLDTRGSGQVCDDAYGCYDTYSPLFEGATEIRLSAGYAMPSSGGTRVIRLQVIDFDSRYERANQNVQGGQDRHSRSISLGIFGVR